MPLLYINMTKKGTDSFHIYVINCKEGKVMSATLSTMLPLGTKASDFNLFNPALNKFQSLTELKSDIATVIVFMCNHCPYVIHVSKTLVEVSDKYMPLGVSFIGINSNDVSKYPSDSPENMVLTAKQIGYNFSYLYDKSQDVARSYQAACTPDFYVFDKDMVLVYRGQFDNSRPNNGISVTGEDLTDALDALLSGKTVSDEQIPSIGCNIKWKE